MIIPFSFKNYYLVLESCFWNLLRVQTKEDMIGASYRVSYKSKARAKIFYRSSDTMTFSGSFMNLTFFYFFAPFLTLSEQNSANLPQILQLLVYDLELCTSAKGDDISQTGHKNKPKIASNDKMLVVLLTDFFTNKTQHKPDLKHISI